MIHYYKCMHDGNVVGLTASENVINVSGFIEINEDEFISISGEIGMPYIPNTSDAPDNTTTDIYSDIAAAIREGVDNV